MEELLEFGFELAADAVMLIGTTLKGKEKKDENT